MHPCPIIGVTCYAERARWGGAWDLPAALLPQAYVDAVAAAGATPVLLPVVTGAGAYPNASTAVLMGRLDALVLTGGGDIAPARYGAEPDAHTAGVQEARDTVELALLGTALERGIPVLGICRGMQVMNVARGGTLHQHLPDAVGTDDHRQRLARFDPHPVTVTPGTLAARALGRTQLDVPSYHHQGVATLGRGVVATARTADGLVEAIEYVDTPHLLGVQWHPEMGDDPSLFTWVARAAASTPLGE